MGSSSQLVILFAISLNIFCQGDQPSPTAASKALNFMRIYGYLDRSGGDNAQLLAGNLSEPVFVEAIKKVQLFGGLEQTGTLDDRTQELMTSRRCGVADIVQDSVANYPIETGELPEDSSGTEEEKDNDFHEHQHSHHHHHSHGHHHTHHHRRKRYILASGGWNKRHLTYYLANWAPQLKREDVERVIDTALDVWAKHSHLTFTPVDDHASADISFGFYRGHHGDGFPFTGPGDVLAHAFFPGSSRTYEGDVHFDMDENWMVDTKPDDNGIDLFAVTLHELGHSLGLSHSPVGDSVMNPYYRSSSKDLGYDDILAVYKLYATRRLDDDYNTPRKELRPSKRPITTTRTTTTTTTTPRYENPPTTRRIWHESFHGNKPMSGCRGAFDTVAYIRGELFIIKNRMLWRLSAPGKVQPGYPVEFRRFFHLLPETVKRIDAIYQRDTDSSIVIFTGPQFWVFDGSQFIEGSPRPLTDYGLPWSMTKVDAITIRNGTTYIFGGSNNWKYDERTKKLLEGSPRPIREDWGGFSTPVDSVMTYKDGITYIFKGNQYWLFNGKLSIPKTIPRTASEVWLAC